MRSGRPAITPSPTPLLPTTPSTPSPTSERTKPQPQTPGGTLWAEPAPSPSFLTPTPDTINPQPRTPGGTLWAEPAPFPNYLTPTPDTTMETPSPTPPASPTRPPLLPRPRLPIWLRYGKWRARNHQPVTPHRPLYLNPKSYRVPPPSAFPSYPPPPLLTKSKPLPLPYIPNL